MADLNIVGCNWIEIPAGKYFIRQMITRGITQQLKIQSRFVDKNRNLSISFSVIIDVRLNLMHGPMILFLIQLKVNGNVLLHYVS
jgi:hypothetical protein